MPSPTSRSLEYCRKIGWTAQVVERWIPQARKRIDLFGCIDIVAIVPSGAWWDGEGVLPATMLGIQACAGASHAARREKALAEPRLRIWLEAGGRFEVWSWAKQGARGKRKLWTLRRDSVTWADLAGNNERVSDG